MRFERKLAQRNLCRKTGRTAALILLAAFLSFSIFGGSIVVMSLKNGLKSYEARLGADVVVVPYEAQTKGTLESILLQGIPGFFYMDRSYYEKVAATEGVKQATPQFYLASTSAGCCSVPVQIIGFDPDTDFVVKPWIRESFAGDMGDGDILIGSNIEMPLSGNLTFYNTECRVVGQLEQTGTGLDTAVYANMDTIRSMTENAKSLGFQNYTDLDVGNAISSVMVQVEDGYGVGEVTDDINIHVRHVEATPAKQMVSNIAGGLSSVTRIIGLLTGMIWLLALVILMIAFVMIAGERKKEFAVLRVMGASQTMLARLLLAESAIISLIGSLLGAVLAAVIVFPFSNLIHSELELPYLLPGAGTIVCLFVGSVLLSVLAGALTALWSALKISRNETGLILREGA